MFSTKFFWDASSVSTQDAKLQMPTQNEGNHSCFDIHHSSVGYWLNLLQGTENTYVTPLIGPLAHPPGVYPYIY